MAHSYSPFPDTKLTDLAVSAHETKVVISEKNEQSLKDLAFGSLAGVAGKFVEFPFDTVKVRLQTQPLDHPIFKGPFDCFRQTVRNEGFLGLYNGLSSPLVGAMLENAVLFVGYRRAQDMLREFVAVPDQNAVPGAEPAPLSIPMLCLSGGISGVFASMVLTPVELVKCKLQVQQIGHLYTKDPTKGPAPKALHSGPLSVIKHIYTQHGLRGFYLGHFPTFLRETGGGAAWFGSYEAVCRLLIAREQLTAPLGKTVTQSDLTAPHLMFAGALAGMAYNFILFPADCIKSHMQTQDELRSHARAGHGGQFMRQGFMATGKEIFRSEGLRGLYRGCGITVARSAPSSAVIFLTYELLSRRFM
ncbi:mitochondrial ornithine carrier protein [Entomortierella parvispora]|uniref:Mitochondrial ornithine carrier protein n=1 Tax=Entomortierella parvispora TaxID=205924 RepID=A0A9P3M1E8_9FUNG|nr:mitochondrial ornithine carrier protein [Entomortierella parvispora]